MLNNSSAIIGVNLGEVLVASSKKITAVPGSLIGELSRCVENNRSCFSDNRVLSSEDIAQELISAASGERRDNAYVPSEHDSYMDNYIEDMEALVRQYLSFARGVVNQEVNSLHAAIVAATDSYRHRAPEEIFNVSYYALPDVFKLDFIQSEIAEQAESRRILDIGHDLLIDPAVRDPEDDYLKLLSSGDEKDDILIRGYVDSFKHDAIRYLNQNVDMLSLTLPSLIQYNFVNWLYYRRIANGGSIDSNEGLSTIAKKAAHNTTYFAAALATNLKQYKQVISAGILLSAPVGRFSYFTEGVLDVCVYEESFAKLAEAGFGIETIFGWISRGSPSNVPTVKEIIADGEFHNKNWRTTRSLYQTHLNSKRLDTFKHLALITYEASVHDKEALTDAEKEIIANDFNYVATTNQMVADYLKNLTEEDIGCPHKVALDIVGKIRFRFSNAYDILCRIKCILDEDESADPMYAALMAIKGYLVDYCLEQTQLTSGVM